MYTKTFCSIVDNKLKGKKLLQDKDNVNYRYNSLSNKVNKLSVKDLTKIKRFTKNQ